MQLDIVLLPARGVMACNATWENRRTATINSIDLWIHYFRRRIPAIPVPCKPTEENIRDSERVADITSTFILRVLFITRLKCRYAWVLKHFSLLSDGNKKKQRIFCIIHSVKCNKRHDETQSLFLWRWCKHNFETLTSITHYTTLIYIFVSHWQIYINNNLKLNPVIFK